MSPVVSELCHVGTLRRCLASRPIPRPAASSYALNVIEAGRRKRNQPAPPRFVFEALTQPNRDSSRFWLLLLDDEVPPLVIEAVEPHLVVWSSLWIKRPDAQVRFDLSSDGGLGTALCWTIMVDDQLPDPPLLGHIRKRMNFLINASLRYSFGQ